MPEHPEDHLDDCPKAAKQRGLEQGADKATGEMLPRAKGRADEQNPPVKCSPEGCLDCGEDYSDNDKHGQPLPQISDRRLYQAHIQLRS